MHILIIGNSNIFKRKIYQALLSFKSFKIELASKRKVKDNYNLFKIYRSYTEALKKTNAKIIYISLVNSKHFQWTKKALEANKHVIVDKPLTLSFKNSKKLIDLAKKKNLLIQEATVFYLHNQFRTLFKKINFNKKIYINTFFHIPKLKKNNFRNNINLGGGCFNDMSTYASYIISFFLKRNKKDKIEIKRRQLIRNNLSENFVINAKTININYKGSFKFNSTYKNFLIIKNDNFIYKVKYIFSPPIDKNLIVEIINNSSKEKIIETVKNVNVFKIFFNKFNNKLKYKNYNMNYNKLLLTEHIRNEIR